MGVELGKIAKLFIRKNFLILVLASSGVIFLGIGLIQLFTKHENQIEFEKGNALSGGKQEAKSANSEARTILVDVSGAVLNPGVYKLSTDARLQDALIAAGGLSVAADRNYVSQRINLAQKLTDGMKVYIPKQDEVNNDSMGDRGNKGNWGGSGDLPAGRQGLVNINAVTAAELEALPGVGSVTAQKIIDGRPYGSIDELLSKKVVGKSVFEKIKERISVY